MMLKINLYAIYEVKRDTDKMVMTFETILGNSSNSHISSL